MLFRSVAGGAVAPSPESVHDQAAASRVAADHETASAADRDQPGVETTSPAGEAPRSRWLAWIHLDKRVPEALESRESRLRLAVGALAVLLALQWWNARTDISDLRRELAQRLQSGDNLNTQTKLIANRVDDEVKVLQGKVAVLEAKQIESQGQQLALEQLYQDLAKNRDDWALAEIEQVLSTASQQ